MELYRPLCGNMGVHPDHMHWAQDFHMAWHCEGLSQPQADVSDMVRTCEFIVSELSHLEDVTPWLEVGPRAMLALQASVKPSFADVLAGSDVKIDMPVRLVDGQSIPPHGWRIVVDQGVIRDGVG
jgi:hypothetical protein